MKNKLPKKNIFETEFTDLPISTQTIIVMTNFELDIKKFFNPTLIVPIVPNTDISSFEYLKNGSIVFMKVEDQELGIEPIKGASRSKRTEKSSKKSYRRGIKNFLNSLTIVMYIKIRGYPKKFMNFKISRNGKFQITGCKCMDHAKACVKNIWKISNNTSIFPDGVLKTNETPRAIFKKVMINTDFEIGYEINRETLDTYITNNTHYISNFERSGGYTGVNIKFICSEPENFEYPILTWDSNSPSSAPVQSMGIRDDWYSMMSETDIKKEKRKIPKVTALIFVSGKIIISGPYMEELQKVYTFLRELFKNNKKLLEQNYED